MPHRRPGSRVSLCARPPARPCRHPLVRLRERVLRQRCLQGLVGILEGVVLNGSRKGWLTGVGERLGVGIE